MRFARLGERGHEIPALVDGDVTRDLRSITADIDGEFLATGVERVAEALEAGTLPELEDADQLRVGAPIARPGSVICIGMNYAAHAREGGSEPPTEPVMFFKTPNTVTGPFDQVVIPSDSEKTDWEVELAIVIGKPLYRAKSHEEALESVAGYTLCNDLSERTWQLEISGGQWSKGKCAPDYNPTGPYLVTPDEVDPSNLHLTSFVNGEPRQDSNTSDLIFSVEEILLQLSRFLRLEPGDLVLTGTPQGVALSGRFPYLKAGDVAEVAIDGLGRQRTEFIADPAI